MLIIFPSIVPINFCNLNLGICQFGLAHVDTPKGDLDASGGPLTGPTVTVIPNDAVYPFGTTEQYPNVIDMSGGVQKNSAHEYRECSNKGICDRASGTCACFEGYDGSACQRASCPSNENGLCSGHGVCETIKEIADRDFSNIYKLWDERSTMGCVCDGGYIGPDCSQKVCKYGVDPLYSSMSATVKEYPSANPRYSNFTYQFYTESSSAMLTGNYSLVFYDAHGEDWETEPIDWDADCTTIRAALKSLPNDVIRSVRCYKFPSSTFNVAGIDPIVDANVFIKSKYTLAFTSNPGKLPQIGINKFLDGNRPTLFTNEATSTLGYHVYPNGFIGEEVDFVPDLCDGVLVNLNAGTTSHYLSGLTETTTKMLKRCLGNSDGYDGDNVEVYNWDYGNATYPHLIKLVDATQNYDLYQSTVGVNGQYKIDSINSIVPITQLCETSEGNPAAFGVGADGIGYCSNFNPPGFFAVLVYDEGVSATNPFRLLTRAAMDYGSQTFFYVFTTKGYLQQVSPNSGVFTDAASYTSSQSVSSHYTRQLQIANITDAAGTSYFGNIDCETNRVGSNGAIGCINKDDYTMFLKLSDTMTSTYLNANPEYPNIYQVKKISKERKTFMGDPSNPNSYKIRLQMQLDYGMNARFTYRGGAANPLDTTASVYKFYPATTNPDGGYRYAAECATRGVCNQETGLCECFPGYTNDNCDTINSLAV